MAQRSAITVMGGRERATTDWAGSGREHKATARVPAMLGSRRTIDTLLHVPLACFGWAARARDAGLLNGPGGLLGRAHRHVRR